MVGAMGLPRRVLVIGLGSVSRATLPLLFRHLPLSPGAYTVLDQGDGGEAASWVKAQGAAFVQERLTRESFASALERYVGPGDLIIDLAWNLQTLDLLDWCRDRDVRFVNASIELWDPYEGVGTAPPAERTLYTRHMALREMFARWGDNAGPTAVLDHGANPGLVSHFVKAALDDMVDHVADQSLVEREDAERMQEARAVGAYNRLAEQLGVKVIHISERDTQISNRPKEEGEFVNTWSVEGFYEEGIAPAEMGWGTHERTLPPGAQEHAHGPRNQICLDRPGCQTWVRSWVPCGPIVGMVIRHGEAFSIAEHLTVEEGGSARYRPTVHYAYCPTDAAIASLHELHMRGFELQPKQRIMDDDIISGRDELGCLLMGPSWGSWWIGSLLDIHEARGLVPGQNATTVQVAAGVLGAVQYVIEEPHAGVRLPDELPHRFVLQHARPYLGPVVSRSVDWDPRTDRVEPVARTGTGPIPDQDRWQFTTFLVESL